MLLACNFLMAITAQAMQQSKIQRDLRISNIFWRQLCLVMDFCCKASAYLACMLVSPERSNPHRFPLLGVIKLFCPLLCHNQRVHIGHSQMSANKSRKEHGSKWPAKRTRLIELPTQVCSSCTQHVTLFTFSEHRLVVFSYFAAITSSGHRLFSCRPRVTTSLQFILSRVSTVDTTEKSRRFRQLFPKE